VIDKDNENNTRILKKNLFQDLKNYHRREHGSSNKIEDGEISRSSAATPSWVLRAE
jgi:hypothetical protein